jgi:GH15 family glucan-1,4-alpha-glucosidase
MTTGDHLRSYLPISDYGLIGDMHSCALVSSSGSIDWCCFPRFDGRSVFGRLLDFEKGGHFSVRAESVHNLQRRYLPETNVLETTFETATGVATLTDFMPVHPDSRADAPEAVHSHHQIVRVFECISGKVQFVVECKPRFDYGSVVPHVEVLSDSVAFAHGGADGLLVYCSAALSIDDDGFRASGVLSAGERVCSAVTYYERFGHLAELPDLALDDERLGLRLKETLAFWHAWSNVCTYRGQYRERVLRSALALKALTYAPTGALLAAATTSLPEHIGGERNWDYRFTWIRDATFALYALSIIGYQEEARYFKDWLEWSTLGRARDLQLMYGIAGERRLTEVELSELDGYRGSRPARVGNAAFDQFQLDIYGEILDSAHLYRRAGGDMDVEYWAYLRRVVNFVIDHWREPDEGIWETRGGRQHFVFSKVMCWVALDRAIKAAKALGLPAELDLWRKVRAQIRTDVLARGFDTQRGVFVQAYGSQVLDASTLMLPLVGFIRATDPRMRATIEAIQRELTSPEGFVYRYRGLDDGLSGEEGTFTICSFWLADNLIALGDVEQARILFERVCSTGNDLGLFSEQYDSSTMQMLGNFPQAFSHMGLINAAVQLDRAAGPPG